MLPDWTKTIFQLLWPETPNPAWYAEEGFHVLVWEEGSGSGCDTSSPPVASTVLY